MLFTCTVIGDDSLDNPGSRLSIVILVSDRLMDNVGLKVKDTSVLLE